MFAMPASMTLATANTMAQSIKVIFMAAARQYVVEWERLYAFIIAQMRAMRQEPVGHQCMNRAKTGFLIWVLW